MRSGWNRIKLSEACTLFTDGNWIESKDQSPEGIRLIQTGNIGLGEYLNKRDKSRFVSEDTFKRLKCTEIFPGDILVSRLPKPVGRSCVIPDIGMRMITGVDCTIIRTKNILLTEFLRYLQLSNEFLNDVDSRTTGTTRSRISRKNLGLIEIPIPPLEEQQCIIAILDKAFAAINQAKANVERNLQNATELFQSKLNEIFSQKGDGWVEKKLESLGTLTSSKRIYKKEYVKEGIPFYRSKEIKELAHNKEISLELFITKERYKEIKSQFGIPQKGDILLTAVGTIGEMYVVKGNEEFYFKDGNIMWLKNFTSLNTYYLKFALLSYVEQLKAMSRGSAYNALTIEKLKNYSVPVPPIKMQEEIVLQLNNLLELTKKCELAYRKRNSKLVDLKKSILQKAFAGELTNKKE